MYVVDDSGWATQKNKNIDYALIDCMLCLRV